MAAIISIASSYHMHLLAINVFDKYNGRQMMFSCCWPHAWIQNASNVD